MKYQIDKIERGSATIIIVTPQKKYILQHRDDFPNIEFPGYWSFLAGWIEVNETPMDAIKRELKEELTKINGSEPKFGEIEFLGSGMRQDRPWTEYVFSVIVYTPVTLLKINEGQRVEEFTYDQCIQLEKFAPHHKKHLIKYHDAIKNIINT